MILKLRQIMSAHLYFKAWRSKALHKQDRQCRCKHKTMALSRNHCCTGKAVSIIIKYVCFVALVIQQAKRMRLIILLSLASLAPPYFSTLSHKRHDFQKKKKKLLNIKFVFWFSLQLSVSDISHVKKNSASYYYKRS